jgi:hypothetical protein
MDDTGRDPAATIFGELRFSMARDSLFILFGSRARGDHRVDSDVDLLIVSGNAADDERNKAAVRGYLARWPQERGLRPALQCMTWDNLELFHAIGDPWFAGVLEEGRVVGDGEAMWMEFRDVLRSPAKEPLRREAARNADAFIAANLRKAARLMHEAKSLIYSLESIAMARNIYALGTDERIRRSEMVEARRSCLAFAAQDPRLRALRTEIDELASSIEDQDAGSLETALLGTISSGR